MAQQRACVAVPKYQQTNVMGRGAFGTVYKVSDSTTREVRALKLLSMTIPNNEIPLIKREILILLKLKHTNIVATDNAYVLNETKNEVFNVTAVPAVAIIMELCDSDLEKKLRARVAIDAKWNTAIFKQLIAGVYYLHQNGVIHRDLKPANILFKGQTLKIGDFGLAKGGVFSKAANHSICGTPLYMPPEVRDGKPYDKSVDIYSMGIILVEIYSTAAAFSRWGGSLRTVEYNTPLLREHQLTPALIALVAKMTQAPAGRPSLTEINKHF